MKFLYVLGLIGVAQAVPGMMPPPPPRALHKVYDLHPREHMVDERAEAEADVDRRAEPTDPGAKGVLETMEMTINILSTSIRSQAQLIRQTAGTISNTTGGPGVNQLLLTGENLIESALNNMALAIQHSTAHIIVTRAATDSGLLGAARGLTQRDVNALATSLQELTSLMGTIRDIITITVAGLTPAVRQVLRPDVNVVEAALGPLLQPIRVIIVSVINFNKNNAQVDTTQLNGVPESLESILDAMVNNVG
ncbi:hypothetical protein Micbo1qcDRAFT_209053 [Microdochium bolleyi]|uniref:Hydrophobic surface binding protein A-domain-containing protein n=1 Tax=Microdochium bolleyi TaxID=196109 RepID=A0A136IND1_9PEZI|nr:hypothetical protein Micbo1qcDRAFT_209053 [Microdochium bolleyi]